MHGSGTHNFIQFLALSEKLFWQFEIVLRAVVGPMSATYHLLIFIVGGSCWRAPCERIHLIFGQRKDFFREI